MIVYKIGGSSLDCEHKLNSILNVLNKNKEKKIIVVSAIGRYPNPYSTDTLLNYTNNVSKEEKDLLVSSGEIISSVILSDFLNKNKITTIAISPYVFNVKKINKNIIINYFKKYDIIVIPGFIYTNNNLIYTMARGGSTLTSAILSKYFSKELIIITDVCGIYNEKLENIPLLTYNEFIKLNKSEVFFPKEAITILNENKISTSFIKYDDCSKCSKIIPD